MSSSNLDVHNTKSKIKMKLKQYNSMQLEYNQMLQSSVQSQSKQQLPPWKHAIKTNDVMFLSTIGEWFWGTKSSGDVFACKKPCDGDLIPISKQAYTVSTDGTDVYVAGKDNTLAKRPADPNAPGDWTNIPTPSVFAYIVSTPDTPGAPFSNKLWGVDMDNKLYVSDKPCKQADDWSEVKTTNIPKMTWISVDNDYIWALSSEGGPGSVGTIYKQKLSCGITGADKWQKVDDNGEGTSFTNVDASNLKYVTATSNLGFVYQCEKPCNGGKWKKINSKPDDKSILAATGIPGNDEIFASTTIDGVWSYDTNTVFSPDYSWTEQTNKNAGGADIGSNKDWVLLGSVDTLDECKEKASTSNDTYSSVVYFTPQYSGDEGKSKSCYGMFYGADSSSTTTPIDMENVVTSVPPDGVSKIGGKKAHVLLQNMHQVQDELAKLIDNIEKEKVTVKMTGPSSSNMTALTESLNRNKGLINDTLLKSNVFAKEEIAELKENTSFVSYISWLILGILSITLCIQLVRNDASSVPSIVYILLAVFILYNIRSYFFAFSDTSSSLLSSVGNTLSSV
jgi:hypothetical protein